MPGTLKLSPIYDTLAVELPSGPLPCQLLSAPSPTIQPLVSTVEHGLAEVLQENARHTGSPRVFSLDTCGDLSTQMWGNFLDKLGEIFENPKQTDFQHRNEAISITTLVQCFK